MLLTKGELEVFYKALKGTEGVLSLRDARIRDAFMKALTEATSTFEGERKAIYEAYCNKLEDGTPDTTANQYTFAPEVLPKLNEELGILVKESVNLTPPEGLAGILEQTEYKPQVGEVELIDKLLTSLKHD